MKGLVGFIILSMSFHSFAGSILSTQVKEIDHAQFGEDQTLIYLGDGSVAKVNKFNDDLIDDLQSAKDDQSWVEITLNNEREIEAVASTYRPAEFFIQSESNLKHHNKPATPTVVEGYDETLKVFRGLNRRYKDKSQCYNRAHVWSWEMLTKHQIQPMKVFMFFHRKYIRKFNFDWWFHVAPYVYVREDGKVIERVMDYRYTKYPAKMKEWTDVFMKNNAECLNITKYTDYEFNREDNSGPWCYLLRTNAYYYQPLDMESLEKKGKQKTYWVEWELNNAYREAFGL